MFNTNTVSPDKFLLMIEFFSFAIVYHLQKVVDFQCRHTHELYCSTGTQFYGHPRDYIIVWRLNNVQEIVGSKQRILFKDFGAPSLQLLIHFLQSLRLRSDGFSSITSKLRQQNICRHNQTPTKYSVALQIRSLSSQKQKKKLFQARFTLLNRFHKCRWADNLGARRLCRC